jgi:hypothetical protein
VDLERVAAVIRPRNPWEAIDLGFGMVRAWWRPVGAAWLATVAPAWCLLFLLLSGKPVFALFLLWWLRPLFDRVPLYVVSRCLFGAPPPRGAVVAELHKLWGRDLWAALTVQRFDPARAFHLPVGQLEGLTGFHRRQRIALLNRDGLAQAVWLTLGCAVLEIAMALALLEAVGLMAPQPESGLAAALQAAAEGDAPYWLHLLAGAVAFLAFTAIEPFYVAAGFSLYLSRRTRLEGWDVEIAFRRLAGRLRGRAAAALLLGLLWLPAAAHAFFPGEDPQEAVHRILAEPEFRTREKVTTWQRRDTADPQPATRRPRRSTDPSPVPGSGSDPLDRAAPAIPSDSVGVVGLTVAVLVLIALAALSFAAWRDWRRRPRTLDPEGDRPLPETVFGLDIRPESLPDDIPAAAWAAWESGDPTAALALLYRGALACLVHRDNLEIAPSWTESDCLAAVRKHLRPGPGRSRSDRTDPSDRTDRSDQTSTGPAQGGGRGGDLQRSLPTYFAQLTAAWQSTAYAHRPPAREEAQALCGGWSGFFRAHREAA